ANRSSKLNIAARLAHLLALEIPQTVREDSLWQRFTRRHQEGGPVNGVKAQDFLADQMQVGRPEVLEFRVIGIAHTGHIAGERVRPNVEDVLLIARPGDAPLQCGAADGEVTQAAADK